MKKKFDCVEMKRKVQETIYEETRDMTREQELAYFHDAAEKCRADMADLRKARKVPRRRVVK